MQTFMYRGKGIYPLKYYSPIKKKTPYSHALTNNQTLFVKAFGVIGVLLNFTVNGMTRYNAVNLLKQNGMFYFAIKYN